MKRSSIAIIKAILEQRISSFELKASQPLFPSSEINVVEEFNFNNPIELLPEIPCPIDPSDLRHEEPIGYMWSDGTITQTEDKGSKGYSRLVPKDDWLPLPDGSMLTDLPKKGVLTSDTEKSDVYIYGTCE